MLRALRISVVVIAVLAILALTALLVLRSSVAHTRGTVLLSARHAAASDGASPDRLAANSAAGGRPSGPGRALDDRPVYGLADDVRVVRDMHGIPHIEARSRSDAVFALGFVHAQDRLWQMEFQRRLGSGRLAEAVGEGGLMADRFFRTLGLRRAAEASLAYLTEEERSLLETYVAGVNAFLDTRTGLLPPEFLVLGLEPEPWTPADVVVWQKMMAWDLTGSQMNDEILRARLARALGAERAAELFPPYPDDAPTILPDFSALYRDVPWDALANAVPNVDPANGSNAWVVSAAHTATARPLLANDPHLGLQAPSLWYFVHLSAPGYDVIGATLPGTPAVLLGHNRSIAWGLTNTGADVLDLFVERIDPGDPSRYLTPDGPTRFTSRRETIEVAGAEDVVLEVRETRHGPVISDVVDSAAQIAHEGHVVAMRWTALDDDDTTIGAALALGEAQDWAELVSVLERWVVPQQTIVYGDVDGNIGLIAPARIPIRAGGMGSSPAPGWTGEYDWVDTVPYAHLPRQTNPDDGVLVAANQRLVGPEYPYHLTDDWSSAYRAERIHALLGAVPRHSLDTFATVQGDVVSLHARALLEWLRSADPGTGLGRAARALVADWDGGMTVESPAPLVFSAWYRALVREILEDDLGASFDAYYDFRPLFIESVLAESSAWCDDTRTTVVETCGDMSARALRIAAAELAERYGEEPAAWRWGDAHEAVMDHAVLSDSLLRPLFDLSAPNDGGPFTIDVGSFPIGKPYEQDHGPGFRGLYDLADLDNSRYIHSTGQSGNPLSARYRDLLPLWIDNEYVPMQTNPDEYLRGHTETLTLRAAP